MHKLLSRQIRKFLSPELSEQPDMVKLFEAINKSYADNDSKMEIIQRSTLISSEELSEANENLKEKAEAQKKIIESLERSLVSLKSEEGNDENEVTERKVGLLELAKKLEEQSSEINRISAEKDLLLKNLEERNELLNNYAHMVSHDLKSPMRNINFLVGCIKEVDESKFSAESLENCMLISENLEKMDALVDGILKHATITDSEDHKINIDVSHLLEDILKTIYVPDNVVIEIKEPMPTIFVGKYKIEQLFKNFLTNAITALENNSEGLITIKGEDMPEFWKFSIADNGKGIAKKHQEDIFTMFKKIENDFKSTGIGLALVKKIVNSFNGKIWLNSNEGEGATFFFTIKK